MNNQEVLEIAIEKALTNGWNKSQAEHAKTIASAFPNGAMVRTFLYDPEFAKALWGEGDGQYPVSQIHVDGSHPDEYSYSSTGVMHFVVTLKNWQYQLQQMVAADDPIKYLGENI